MGVKEGLEQVRDIHVVINGAKKETKRYYYLYLYFNEKYEQHFFSFTLTLLLSDRCYQSAIGLILRA